jgi:hypothetical protein
MGLDKSTRQSIVQQKLDAHLQSSRVFEGLSNTIVGRSSVQLFGVKKGRIRDPIASGVLFKATEVLFILTAAHAADEFKNEAAFVQFNGSFLQVKGPLQTSKLPESGKRGDDVYDFAVIRIDDTAAAELLKPLAATLRDVYVPPEGYLHLEGKVVYGFPTRDLKFKGRMLQSSSYALGARGGPLATHENLGIDPNHHIVLKYFNTTYSPSGFNRSRSMRGMSGGGVWLVPELVGEPFPPESPFTTPKLMGIFTELRKSSSVAMATKVSFHLDKIMEAYPGVLLNRPPTGPTS